MELMMSAEVEAEVWECLGNREISERCARSIAMYHQSPGRIGRHLAAYASGARVSMRDVYEDTCATGRELGWSDALNMLATYCLNHPEFRLDSEYDDEAWCNRHDGDDVPATQKQIVTGFSNPAGPLLRTACDAHKGELQRMHDRFSDKDGSRYGPVSPVRSDLTD